MNTIQAIWEKRSILYNFAISDLRIRYRNSALGFFWTFLEPLLMLTVLYIVFTNLFKSQIDHFPLYILLGIIVWNMFSRGTSMSLSSLLTRSSILTQVYLPREIPPISSAITAFMMLCFELIVFGIFMVVFQFTPTNTMLFLPVILLLEFILILGLSFPLSVLNVRYRDIQFIWGVVLQIGFFLTPIFYKSDILPKSVSQILAFSPMVQIINMAHDVVLANKLPDLWSLEITIVTTLAVFGIGYAIFRKMQVRIMEEL
jgi:lipopolysaccharide transport system permease protein